MLHKVAVLLLVTWLALQLSCVGGAGDNSGQLETHSADELVLDFVSPDVGVHQGYATDGKVHFLLDTARITKRAYDANWSLIAVNHSVFSGLIGYNHLGDGDYYRGQLYVAAEFFVSCNIYSTPSLFVFDADTMERVSVSALADTNEASGLAVDPDAQEIWVPSYCDGSRIWVYDLATRALKRTVGLRPNVSHIQGIAIGPDAFYLSQNEGSVWRLTRDGTCTQVYQSTVGGQHEGLDYSQNELRWLIDSGTAQKKIYYLVPKQKVEVPGEESQQNPIPPT